MLAQARPAGTLPSKLLPMKSKWRAVRPQAVEAGVSVDATVREGGPAAALGPH